MQDERELTSEQRQFHLEEFRKLNGEILELTKSASQTFSFAVAASGAIFVWLLTSTSPQPVRDLGLGIPLLLTIVLGWMARSRARRIIQMGDYLRRLEVSLGHPALGWERFFARQSSVVRRAATSAWILLFLGNLAGGLLVLRVT